MRCENPDKGGGEWAINGEGEGEGVPQFTPHMHPSQVFVHSESICQVLGIFKGFFLKGWTLELWQSRKNIFVRFDFPYLDG